jgi:hypothetical protein
MKMGCTKTARAHAGGRPSGVNRSRTTLPGATLSLCLALGACSGEDDPSMSGSMSTPGSVPPGGTNASPATPSGSGVSPGVSNYDRPLGMPIGQGASGNVPAPAAAPDAPPVGTPDENAAVDEDLEIPVFVPMEEPPPCSGCVEFKVDVDDINQRDNFVFGPSATNVTRVVWTLIVPFNSDQLFVQPFVDNAYGTFTDLDANAFAVGTPVELVHQYSGNAGTVGLAVGSSGAWTGNMTMSVFVDSVTLEGADAAASRTFDADVGGFVVGSNTHNPQIVYHP